MQVLKLKVHETGAGLATRAVSEDTQTVPHMPIVTKKIVLKANSDLKDYNYESKGGFCTSNSRGCILATP